MRRSRDRKQTESVAPNSPPYTFRTAHYVTPDLLFPHLDQTHSSPQPDSIPPPRPAGFPLPPPPASLWPASLPLRGRRPSRTASSLDPTAGPPPSPGSAHAHPCTASSAPGSGRRPASCPWICPRSIPPPPASSRHEAALASSGARPPPGARPASRPPLLLHIGSTRRRLGSPSPPTAAAVVEDDHQLQPAAPGTGSPWQRPARYPARHVAPPSLPPFANLHATAVDAPLRPPAHTVGATRPPICKLGSTEKFIYAIFKRKEKLWNSLLGTICEDGKAPFSDSFFVDAPFHACGRCKTLFFWWCVVLQIFCCV
ncbi:proline-rich receptor-like protein kinase PERK2 [Triticum dicoccoides]|uniref:proline-rich receptor-like protein kinase PERK2 n=1 Tax=Triticum dicoccoides TaxID=85692 RepID=UPI001890D260|nr:proline-rich receptor-like protein kinase PERK2 [Triticum dicoccoides]